MLKRSIGASELRNGNLVASETMDVPYLVRMFSPSGVFIKELKAEVPFFKPACMISLNNGNFAVIDDNGVHGFDMEGNFIWDIQLPRGYSHYGLVEDSRGLLVTIQDSNGMSAVLLYLDPVSGRMEGNLPVFPNLVYLGVSVFFSTCGNTQVTTSSVMLTLSEEHMTRI
jgi:hypothetical protein